MKTPTWIWFYGDFEIWHHLLVNTRRLEENLYRPSPWRLDDCWHNVMFERTYILEKAEKIRVRADGNGCVNFHSVDYPLNEWIEVPAGETEITVEVYNVSGLPSIYIEDISKERPSFPTKAGRPAATTITIHPWGIGTSTTPMRRRRYFR